MAMPPIPSGYNAADVPLPITGGCQCGALRYRCEGQPLVAFNCHCNRCQKFSGTGHGSYILLPGGATQVSGERSVWSYVADSGANVARHFCPICGTHVFGITSRHPGNFVALASSLDDRTLFRPTLALFTAEAAPWDAADASLQCFPVGA